MRPRRAARSSTSTRSPTRWPSRRPTSSAPTSTPSLGDPEADGQLDFDVSSAGITGIGPSIDKRVSQRTGSLLTGGLTASTVGDACRDDVGHHLGRREPDPGDRLPPGRLRLLRPARHLPREHRRRRRRRGGPPAGPVRARRRLGPTGDHRRHPRHAHRHHGHRGHERRQRHRHLHAREQRSGAVQPRRPAVPLDDRRTAGRPEPERGLRHQREPDEDDHAEHRRVGVHVPRPVDRRVDRAAGEARQVEQRVGRPRRRRHRRLHDQALERRQRRRGRTPRCGTDCRPASRAPTSR